MKGREDDKVEVWRGGGEEKEMEREARRVDREERRKG